MADTVVHLLRLLARVGAGERGEPGATRGSALNRATVAVAGRRYRLSELSSPLDLEALLPGGGAWQVELGFGKGRFLLQAATQEPGQRFLGVELAGEYFRLASRRGDRRGLRNLMLIHADALFLLAAVLPRGFAEVVHVYFPDPWPKTRHQKRRLFDPETVDLVLGLLRPQGTLAFATDFLAYGELVWKILSSYPGVSLSRLAEWPGGPRTNYEAKYVREGRPILRLEARVAGEPRGLHPRGQQAVVSGGLARAALGGIAAE